MRRREFISALGVAAAWPLAARAQQAERMRRIGVLMGFAVAENDSEGQAFVAAFRDGLRKFGWTEGSNIWIDTRWATPADVESMQRFTARGRRLTTHRQNGWRDRYGN
jgi:putative tryptophan/tyrosine transport system substrate-binding protein